MRRARALTLVGVMTLVAVACALGTHAWLTRTRSEDTPPRWNVLLISVDTLRADHLGCYGYERETSPAIDALASEGTLFAACVATSPWTLPSHMSMLTGQYPTVHGVLSHENKARSACATLAELLHRRGYRTAAVISGGGMRAEQGFGRGFGLYDDYSVVAAYPASSDLSLDEADFPGFVTTVPTARFTNRAALKWLREDADRPFFLFLHYWDVHWDYCPPAPYDTIFGADYEGPMKGRKQELDTWLFPGCKTEDLQRTIALYDGETRWTDVHIGEMLEELKKLGLYDDTIIILTADHGEEFLEHGKHGHGHSLYEELLHVPLIIKLPKPLQPQAPVLTGPVSLVDIMPTVLDALDVARAGGLAGVSLMSTMRSGPKSTRGPLFAEGVKGRNMCMVKLGSYKLILDLDTGWSAYHDLSLDAGELDALPPGTEWGEGLLTHVTAWLKNNQAQVARLGDDDTTVELDDETREMLRSLGYVR